MLTLKHLTRALTVAALMAVAALTTTPAALADGADGAVYIFLDDLTEAEAAYQSGDYDMALKLAERRLKAADANALEKVQAYRLQALSYSAKGNERKARKAAEQLVLIFPEYQVAPTDPPAFNALVVKAQQRFEAGKLRRPGVRTAGKMQYVYMAAGAVITGIWLTTSYQDWK